ncbi:MAG TPA: PrsW family glutamic-type intramembrane protease [Anaerolineales bacterium]|jgi:RsiW-degrading membrane proteinase PrsW (M82 family)|nr:PrsW family glutamic-type intramembrane protease [Anaerolineales bacterium]
MIERRVNDWRTILLAALSIGGGALLFATAVLVILMAVIGQVNPRFGDAPPLLEALLLASALMLIGALFWVAGYFSVQRLRGKETPSPTPNILKVWQGLLLFVLWLASCGLAQVFFRNDILKWFTPPFYLLAIVIPVYLIARLAAGGIEIGSRLRTWGVLFTSMAFGTMVSAFAEIFLVVIGLVGLGVYFGFHPEQASSFKQIMNQLTDASGVDKLLNLVGPWLTNPLAILVGLVFFSGFTPLIEETAKSAAVWSVFDHLESSAQGFAIGALSGAGFGLFESLLASVTPDSNWAGTLLIRGGSTMMHIMTVSLTGWGIASFRINKNYLRLFGGYALAMALHATWNGCVIFIVSGGMRFALNTGKPDLLGAVMIAFSLSLLIILCLAIPVLIGSLNWRFRTSATPTAPSEHLPHLLPPEEDGGGREGVK